MPDLAPITALGAETPRREAFGALTLAENAGLALASLALRRNAARPMPLGLDLPGPGGWAAGEGGAAFWTGPDQWIIAAEGRAEEDFAAAVKAAAPGCSVTEQTDAWVAFEITSAAGPAPIVRLLEKTVNIDPEAFGPGSAQRTGLEHLSVFVIRPAEERLTVLGMRSAAGTLWHALETAARNQDGEGGR